MKEHETDIGNKKAVYADIQDVWVSYYYNKWMLKSVCLKCYQCEILGMVGPNGGEKPCPFGNLA